MTENFHLLLNIIVYFLNFSGIICMMFVFTINFNYFTMVDHLFKNWDMGMISEIKVLDKVKSERENVCPNDYEYLFSYTWLGTKMGCDCLGIKGTSIQDFEDKILVGPCSVTLTKFGCKTIPEIPGKTIHSLGDKYFCVKRNNFSYYSNYSEHIFEEECPSEMKSCGVIDSLDNILCVDKSQDCPVQQKKYLADNSSFIVTDEYNKKYNNNNYPSNSSKNYSLSSLPELVKYYTKFFVQFGISQGKMCIDNDEVKIHSENIYELFNKRKSINCSTKLSTSNNFRYDYRYVPLIKSQTDIVFYKEDFLKKNIQFLPKFYKNFFQEPITVYGRNYIGWNKKCSNYITSFRESYKLALKVKNYSLFYLIYSLVMLIYCMLFVMILKELLYRQYFLKILIIVIHVLMISIIFFFILDDCREISKSIKTCDLLIRKRCSDEETNRLIINALESFISISDLFLITIILYIIIFLLSICKIMLTFYKIYKRKILNRVIQGEVNEFEMMLIM